MTARVQVEVGLDPTGGEFADLDHDLDVDRGILYVPEHRPARRDDQVRRQR